MRVVAVIGTMTSGMTSALLPVHQTAQVVLVSPPPQPPSWPAWTTSYSASTGRPATTPSSMPATAWSGLPAPAAASKNNRVFFGSWVKELKLAFERRRRDRRYRVFRIRCRQPLPVVEKLLQSQPDALVLFVANAGDSARLAQQTRKLDKKLPLIAAEWASTDQLLELGGNSVDGMAVVQQFNADDPSPHFTDFRQRYVKRFGREPAWQRAGARCSERLIDSLTRRSNDLPLKKALIELGPSRAAGKKIHFDAYGDTQPAAPPSPSSRTAASSASSHDGPALASPHLAHPPPRGRLGDCAAHRLCLAAGLLPAAPGRQTRSDLGTKSGDLARRSEAVLSILQGQLELVAGAMADGSRTPSQRQLQQLVSQGAFSAVYHLAADGRIAQAAIASNGGKRVGELIGNDLSNDRPAPCRHAATEHGMERQAPVASVPAADRGDRRVDRQRCADRRDSADLHPGNHYRVEQPVGLGDLGHRRLRRHRCRLRAQRPGGRGQPGQPAGLHPGSGGQPAISTGTFEGQPYDMAASRSGRMNWYFIVRSPAGLNSPQLQTAVEPRGHRADFLTLLSLLFAPLWAAHRPPDQCHRRTGAATGRGQGGRRLAAQFGHRTEPVVLDIEHMAESIRERGRELEIIFESSPVGLLLTEPSPALPSPRPTRACSICSATRARKCWARRAANWGCGGMQPIASR